MTTFYGTAHNDHFSGSAASDDFRMGETSGGVSGGNDRLTGKGGTDYFTFDDSLNAADQIDGGHGFDILTLYGDYSSGVTFGASTVTSIEEFDLYSAHGGDSYSLTIADSTVANDGNLTVLFYGSGTSSAESLHFDASAETSGDVRMETFTEGTDVLIGGGGNDYIHSGRTGNDILDGGGGINQVSFSSGAPGPLTVSLLLQGAAQDVGGGRMVTLSNFQDVTGSSGADTLIGDGNSNWLSGFSGSDTIQANGGDDLVQLAESFSVMHAVVSGGAGIDTLTFPYSSHAAITFSLALQGTAQSIGPSGSTVDATGFENLVGTNNFGDALTGDSHANAIYASGGDDTVNGGDGNDLLFGDKTYGPLYAGTTIYDSAGRMGFGATDYGIGNDSLKGGNGNDALDGGAGVDTLNGGKGLDTYIFENSNDSGVGTGNRDIVSFSHGQHDKLDLHAIDADTAATGNQDFHLGGAAFTHSHGELIQFTDSGHTIIAGDTNGDGIADFEIQLTAAPVLVAGDFVL